MRSAATMPPLRDDAMQTPQTIQTIRVVPPADRYGTASHLPLVLDSPHSGTWYPPDFAAAQPLAALRSAEDTHVDALFASATQYGATLVAAEFPRCYIDCNRTLDDIDASLLMSPWPSPLSASNKSTLGYGLVWRKLDDGSDIYDRQLSVDEVQTRITTCYVPYWRALRKAISSLRDRYGVVWHLNCHSMPSHATHASHLPLGTPHADIVLGDRDGRTCDRALRDMLSTAFRAAGLSVRHNDPYKGVALVNTFGNPAANCHSIQIEVNRALYMDEQTREPNAGYATLRLVIEQVLRQVAGFVAARLPVNAVAD